MDKKVFDLVIDTEDESGVDYIALVDEPAIERDFMKFKKAEDYKFKIQDEDKRIVSGYAMVADLHIVRYDEQNGEHFVKFPRKTIEQIVDKFMGNGFNANVNLMHDPSKQVNDVFVFESLLIDSKRNIKAPEGFQDAPDGSWWVSMRVINDDVWKQCQEGTFKGFSVEGMFSKEEPELTDEDIIDAAIEAIQGKI
jgi:hypothetical protein